MRTHVNRYTVLVALAIAAAGCGSVTPAPTAPTPEPQTMAGLWTGAVGVSGDDGRSLGVIWTAERLGEGRLSGTATLSTLPQAPAAITFVGTMTSVRSGDQYALTFTDANASSDSACTVSATGAAHLDDFTLVGDLDVRYHACDRLGLLPPATTHLQLLKKLN
jgi:hypothetical protein